MHSEAYGAFTFKSDTNDRLNQFTGWGQAERVIHIAQWKTTPKSDRYTIEYDYANAQVQNAAIAPVISQ